MHINKQITTNFIEEGKVTLGNLGKQGCSYSVKLSNGSSWLANLVTLKVCRKILFCMPYSYVCKRCYTYMVICSHGTYLNFLNQDFLQSNTLLPSSFSVLLLRRAI